MTTATLFILGTGLLAMSASLGVAWWLWAYNPVWPWTRTAPPSRPTGSHVAISPAPKPVGGDELERAATIAFVKGKSPEKTEVLTDRHQLIALECDDDAPLAYADQLQTTPNRRAGPPARPWQLPRD